MRAMLCVLVEQVIRVNSVLMYPLHLQCAALPLSRHSDYRAI